MDCGPEAHTMAGEATRAWTDIRPFSGAGKGLSGFYQGVWNTISGLADARWFAAVRWPVVEFLHRSFGVRSTSTLPPARDEHARPARRRCGCPARGRRFGA